MTSATLDLVRGSDLIVLGRAASEARSRFFPDAATYVAAGLLRLAACGDPECPLCGPFGYGAADAVGALAPLPLDRQLQSLVESGATEVVLHGLPDGDLRSVLQTIARARELGLRTHGFSASDLIRLADGATGGARPDFRPVLEKLLSAGMRSFYIGDWTSPEAAALHRAAGSLGTTTYALLSTAGVGVTRIIELAESLDKLRHDSDGCIACVVPWVPEDRGRQRSGEGAGNGSGNSSRSARAEDTGIDYIKAIAATRLLLPEVHVQASWAARGLKNMQIALQFGADDAGPLAFAGAKNAAEGGRATEEEVRRLVRDLGLRAVRRDFSFRLCFRS